MALTASEEAEGIIEGTRQQQETHLLSFLSPSFFSMHHSKHLDRGHQAATRDALVVVLISVFLLHAPQQTPWSSPTHRLNSIALPAMASKQGSGRSTCSRRSTRPGRRVLDRVERGGGGGRGSKYAFHCPVNRARNHMRRGAYIKPMAGRRSISGGTDEAGPATRSQFQSWREDSGIDWVVGSFSFLSSCAPTRDAPPVPTTVMLRSYKCTHMFSSPLHVQDGALEPRAYI